MEAQRREPGDEAGYAAIRRGWRYGAEEFVARMLDRLDGTCGENQTSRERVESMEQTAERIVTEGMEKAGWGAEDLARAAKGHPVKVRLARRLRRETTMTLQWVAKKLSMGAWTYVSNLLRPSAERPNSVNDKD
jgi:hypothetical protein